MERFGLNRRAKGKEAMSSRATHQLAQLWQLPLLLLSLLLFAVSGYLFLNASPGLTVRRRIEIARTYIEHERPQAALQQLNRLMVSERMTQENEASVHLLMGQALEEAQRQRNINIPANHTRIIEQTQLAIQMGIKPTWDVHRRLGDSFIALGKTSSGVDQLRQAMAMEPTRALRLKQKIIEAQTAQEDRSAVLASLDDYLANKELTDAEKAWGLGEKSQVLADRGDFVGARTLIADALRLDNDVTAQAQANYRMAYCAWKLHKLDEAQKLATTARDQFRGGHPMDADAAYLLARVRHEQDDLAGALALYEQVIRKYPQSRWLLPAKLGRATCHVHGGQEPLGISELHELASVVASQQSGAPVREQTTKAVRQAHELMMGKMNFELALSALDAEKVLLGDEKQSREYLTCVAAAATKRGEQIEASAAEATGAERLRRDRLAKELFARAADAQVLVARETKNMDTFWSAVSLYQRAGNAAAATNALELFVAEHGNDPETPNVLLKLAENYSAAGASEKAIAAYKQLRENFSTNEATAKSALPLARAYLATGTGGYPSAERVLTGFLETSAAKKIRSDDTQAAMLELGTLYYRTDQYEKSVRILEELLAQQPAADLASEALFLAADSCRKSALRIEAKVASASESTVAPELTAAVARRKETLTRSRKLYDRLLELYHSTRPTRDSDKQYERQSYFYRGDCAYELANFDEAIRLYDAAAKRYEQEPAVLAAYVQIVNSYCAMGKMDEARVANEKAKALLRNLPAEAFNNGSFTMPKSYWEQWMKWTSNAGAY
jgi:tetratricopeptide (TPR) repeat protein